MNHLPGYIQNLPQLKEKGAQIVAVVASNDPFVMSAWGKANQVTGDDIVYLPLPEPLTSALTVAAVPIGPRREVLRVHRLGERWSYWALCSYH